MHSFLSGPAFPACQRKKRNEKKEKKLNLKSYHFLHASNPRNGERGAEDTLSIEIF